MTAVANNFFIPPTPLYSRVSGSPATMASQVIPERVRPVALRPYLSIGLPFTRVGRYSESTLSFILYVNLETLQVVTCDPAFGFRNVDPPDGLRFVGLREQLLTDVSPVGLDVRP